MRSCVFFQKNAANEMPPQRFGPPQRHGAPAGFYTKDNFFQGALPWVAMDGNSFWCFTYLRAFTVHGVPVKDFL